MSHIKYGIARGEHVMSHFYVSWGENTSMLFHKTLMSGKNTEEFGSIDHYYLPMSRDSFHSLPCFLKVHFTSIQSNFILKRKLRLFCRILSTNEVIAI